MVSMNGFKVIEKYIKPEEVSNYDEAFLTGTAAEVTPIQSIDKNLFQTGEDTQTFKFMQEFHDLVRS